MSTLTTQTDRLRTYLDDVESAQSWLTTTLRLAQPAAGHANLLRIATSGVTLDLLGTICDQFSQVVDQLGDADMALNNLERFVARARNPMAMTALFERDTDALPNLLQIFATSQYLSDVLILDTEAYDILRMTEGQSVARGALVDELIGGVRSLSDNHDVVAALRHFKRRETLRIAYGDIIRSQNVAVVARQISYLADAIVEAALFSTRRALNERYGEPLGPDGRPSQFVVLALGKLGGVELNYSSDIDLVFVYGHEGQTAGKTVISNQDYFTRVCRNLMALLSEKTELGAAYRVDLRLRPEGARGEVCRSLERTLAYYDVKGRTWERQAFVKARAIAGDRDLGEFLLDRLDPWIYRRYLSLADISGIKALKRRIERRAETRGANQHDVKTGHGGIRDIEFVIQFLQLLNGSSMPDLRTGNTLEAIARLEQAGCLMHQERTILEENYAQLRKIEHRLQIMFDLQTHLLPSEPAERRKLAIRMGFATVPHVDALQAFDTDLRQRTEQNRRILDHLLHDLFQGDEATEPEVDLVNDPDPSQAYIDRVLEKYAFQDVPAAYQNLMALVTEKIRFLSTRRCRHFLAGMAPRLLSEIARTPDPDATLMNLSQVSDSLGGKAALWELFSINPPTLNLYVTLCAACPYLADILTSNPGMIDELMDSLVVEKLPTLKMLDDTLADLCRGAEDVVPILHSFKHAQHLRVGVRDVLGKDDIRDTHTTLSDTAETCLKQIALVEYEKLVEKFGRPTIGELKPIDSADFISDIHHQRFGARVGDTCELVVLAMGKLGGREPNYHSDLDLIFLYESDGQTVHGGRNRDSHPTTTNSHFFSELGQRIIKVAGHLGPHGKLYEVDPRLRPTGRSGSLAVPLDAFARYFATGEAQLWERQALCKARPILCSPRAAGFAMQTVNKAVFSPKWKPEFAHEIRAMRGKLEETASDTNLKRGPGGTVDIEFLVQMLQLKHGGEDPNLRVPGTFDALTALGHRGHLSQEDTRYFREAYRFQRAVEARIRLMNSTGRHEFPTAGKELGKLAFLLDYPDSQQLVDKAHQTFAENRARFDQIFDQQR